MKQWKLVKVFPLRTFTNFCPIKMFTRFNSGKHLNNIWFLTIFDLCKSQRLYNLDARKIAVFNAPKVGLIPFERDVHLCDQACLSLLNRMAMLYNCKLKNLLEDLTGNLSGSAIVYVDYYAVMEDIINNYRSYGEVFQQWTLNLGFGRVNELWNLIFFSFFRIWEGWSCLLWSDRGAWRSNSVHIIVSSLSRPNRVYFLGSIPSDGIRGSNRIKVCIGWWP